MNNVSLLRKLLLAAVVLLAPIGASAQVTIGSGNTPSPKALLDIDASVVKKGLHLPRLTKEERDALVSDASDPDVQAANKGLMIFNTDCGCTENWTGDRWFNLCDGVYGAQVDLPLAACSQIRVHGEYNRNSPLTDRHYIVLPIVVTQTGDYDLIATTTNGYYFQASGTFATTGALEIRLMGVGTPAETSANNGGPDHLLITNNGNQIGSACDLTIDVKPLALAYRVNCGNIEVFGGPYQTRQTMSSNVHYVEVPIDVVNLGLTNIQTNEINGIRFLAMRELTTYGEQILVMRANGSPRQEGTFTYSFTTDGAFASTCSFTVNFFSTLGEFADPACNCLAIYDERPLMPNGEYWLQDCRFTPSGSDTNPITRTFCDIAGGGWTLVWSYSENTARNVYVQSTASGGTGNSGTMIVGGVYWANSLDRPRNRINTDIGVDNPTVHRIDYTDFRLMRREWQNLPSSDTNQMKVRITENPTDMNDAWALNNYGIISPTRAADNPLLATGIDNRGRVPAEGKVFGKQWRITATGGGGMGGWDEVSGNRGEMGLYSSSSFNTHWNFGNAGSGTRFDVVPNKGGANNTIAMNNMNNMFGWFGETQVNHHFGKCSSATADDYSFATTTCGSASLFPHSFNPVNGTNQGRYLQWYVR